MDEATKDRVKRVLARAGVSGRDAKELVTWARNRGSAVKRRGGVLEADGVVWTGAGVVEVAPVEVVTAGPGYVTVDVETSMVSPGTERAYYLRLPNARVEYPFRPGYSAAGTVTHVGARVTKVKVGDRVAVSGAPHQSRATVPGRHVWPLPDRVSTADAAFVELGVIAGHGIDKANIGAGVPFVVVGAGPIGLLAQRTASALGAGTATVVAKTARRRTAAQLGGADFVSLDEAPHVVDRFRAPVVIEAAGTPDSLDLALRIAEPGGRVVVLGSDRSPATTIAVDRVVADRLTVVGAHVRTVELEGPGRGAVAERFLQLLATGSLTLDGLDVEIVDPADAGVFYRRLAEGRVELARFDWARGHERLRVSLRPPRIGTRGTSFTGQPAAAPAALAPDHLALARGHAAVALVGCGEIAVRNAEAVAMAPNAELRTCFDPDPRLARELAEAHGAHLAASYEAVLDDPAVDLVVLSVPHHLHAPLAIQALEHGKAVVVEKPPANDLAGALAMARAARDTGVPLSVCFPHRYERRTLEASQLLREGALGRITGFQATWYQDKPPSYWMGGYSGRSMSTWRSSRQLAGGGALVMNASHYVDLMLHLCGSPAEAVMAMTATEGEEEVEDHVALTVRLENGAVAALSACSAVRGARSEEIRVWGLDGHIELAPTPRAYLLRGVGDRLPARWQALPTDGVPYRASYLAALITDLDAGRPPAVGIETVTSVQALLEAAYRSAATGVAACPGDVIAEVEQAT